MIWNAWAVDQPTACERYPGQHWLLPLAPWRCSFWPRCLTGDVAAGGCPSLAALPYQPPQGAIRICGSAQTRPW